MVAIFGSLISIAWVIGIVLAIVFGYLVPYSIFVAMRNIRRIRTQLERLNDSLEGGRLNIKLTIEDHSTTRPSSQPGTRVGAGPLRL